ncbi:NAD(P)-binding protein [Rhodocollybia butyracea]|uniref:Probable quinone oxidoreductase n=1 Tax=Rhodocollybia butyracea TaxID=206335 RepID=A0A9P5U617_9AGAR|nr:NAD(P)-binding protein [Rhodocollybia butyracea]
MSPALKDGLQFPETVEAIAIAQIGDIDVLEKMTLPFPKVEPGHLVVRIEYLGVNFIDTYFRKGLYPLSHFPAVLGEEAAGTIVGLPTDLAVLEDLNFKKHAYKIGMKVAVVILGTNQTYLSIPWTRVLPITHGVSTKLAAAGVSQVATAITFLSEAYTVKAGDIVFIHTIAGGLGMIMTQLAKHLGAKVIGTTSTKEKAELAKACGADEVILYRDEDVKERVNEITGGEGVHVVYDGVGKDTFDLDFEIIRRKGTIVSVGNASGPVPPFSPLKLMPKNIKLLRPAIQNYVTTPEEASYYGNKIFQLISEGVLKINIFKEYPFTTEGARQTHRDLVSGKTTGKLVIKVTE